MPCDVTDDCPFPGKPGYDGALHPENVDVVALWQRAKALGPWVYEQPQAFVETNADELVEMLYVLETENARLKDSYRDSKTGEPRRRLIWDLS